jgi:hypothetical protein
MDLSIHNVPLLWYPDRTFLVPGHGHVYDKLDLLEYRDAITIVRDRVQDLIDQGMTLAQVQAANPTLLPQPVRLVPVHGRPRCSSPSTTSRREEENQ